MEDADVSFMTHMPLDTQDVEIFRRLKNEIVWRHEKVFVWGKWHLQPRLTAWYGDPGKSYSYSGTEMHSLPWTHLLIEIKNRVEELTGSQFNSVLLNLYRDNRDRMGFHSDNERALGPEPTIASLSYGATRTLIFKHKRVKSLPPKSIALTSGSLLLMKGQTQQNWNHGINSESRPCGPRINLTFRQIYPEETATPRPSKARSQAKATRSEDRREPRLL